MHDDSIQAVVEELLHVRHSRLAYDGDIELQSVEQAYKIQDALVDKLGENSVGWKIGCTSKMAQEMSSTDEPFYGRMMAATTFNSPALVNFEMFFAPIVEPEIAFRFGRDLVPRKSPYGTEDIVDAVEQMYPAIEIVDCRYAVGWPIGILPTVADNGVHAAFIIGPEIANWRTVDRPKIPVTAEVDGKFVTDGVGANALDDPLNALVWLANSCSARGHSIRSGEIVTTGNTVTAPIFAAPGNSVLASFGGLGEVQVSFR